MYQQHFALTELPFSIVPNSRFLYQSRRHKEAIFQIQAGLGEGGGFAMLTGEVGTGKTTIAKSILKTLADNTRAGLILNPTFSNIELLEAVCDEFDIGYQENASLKQLNQLIHQFLLDNHANRVQTLLVIDEAQHLSADVLEQLRLLTNLETESQKLLKVLLIGQPELQQKLQMPQLRQLAQRITGRYHLLPLNQDETRDYIKFRLALAGGNPELFSVQSIKYIARQTQGIPRLINLVCDASLKQAYSIGEAQPTHNIVVAACDDVMSFQTGSVPPAVSRASSKKVSLSPSVLSILVGSILAIGGYYATPTLVTPVVVNQLQQQYPAVENVQQQEEVFPQALKAQLNQANNQEVAIAALYKVWGYRASVLDQLCLDNGEALFRCALESGSLEQLAEKNVPVVLTLNIDQQPRFAVLLGLSGTHVQLLANDQVFEFEREWLSSIWQGEYREIWQGYWNQTLKPGMSGEAIAVLDQHLSQVLGEQSSGKTQFNEQLKHKVELFQRWQGLTVDGIAGRKTLRLLEKLSQPQAPTLTSREVSSNV
ncbi:ExeA family protein [Vibrio tubiashii]|uniref:General secretion pathway protein A n=1 Tax=Vibrio tubiashii ATCC 19109 TaxID=1051646 RepID=F9T5F8_9VIBR|nr:AAA family ATPase [Vibrio tubiashii]AIW15038.1 general secretion pathway protein GspA [Vibrio tubiashii ATCC 19109]EGU55119.1 general secretion pathway protein A [Vibrio tubiashii ATCC 19109]EIF01511.1 general secretion pathway protein A [Vibrio tubiashii NCIMB 1337 = ATCC 19106]